MGRDTRSNVGGYYTRAKLFKRIVANDGERIYYSPKPKVFYAKYHFKFSFFNPNLTRTTAGEVINREASNTYIITRDLRPEDVSTNDRIEFEGVTYEVQAVEVTTMNRQTSVTNRTECELIIKLE